MKHILPIFILYVSPMILHAQPAPCMNENIIVIDKISAIDTSDYSLFIGQIKLKGSEVIKWDEIIDDKTIHYDSLEITHSYFNECYPMTYYSKESERVYLTGFNTYNGIIVIQSNNKSMYLVFPSINRIFSSLLKPILTENYARNNKDQRGYYTPYLYFESIKFKEGIYFMDDYQLNENLELNSKKLLASQCAEFYTNINMHPNPLSYWKDTLYFYNPYNQSKNIQFSKKIKGHFTESEAIKRIVENSPNYLSDILHYYRTKFLWTNRQPTDTMDPLRLFLYDLRQYHQQQLNELITKSQNDEINQDQLVLHYHQLETEQLFLVLENDFDLMWMFIHYYCENHARINDFISLFDEKTFKFDRKELRDFLRKNVKDNFK